MLGDQSNDLRGSPSGTAAGVQTLAGEPQAIESFIMPFRFNIGLRSCDVS